MKVTGSDLMKLLRMITTLSIIHNPTFWVAHDAYLSSRFKLLTRYDPLLTSLL